MVVNTVNEPEQNVSRARQCKAPTLMRSMPLQVMKNLMKLIFVFLLVNINTAYAATEDETWVVLGDSISAGYGIPDGQGWVTLLQEKLDASGYAIQLINESISGDTTAGGLARLPEILERIKPNAVIIELGGNDGLRGLSTRAMEDNLSKMIALSLSKDIRVLLLGMKTPPNYGRKYGELFESVFASVSKQYKIRLLPFLLEGVGGFQEHMQDDRIHPNSGAQKMLLDNVWFFLGPVLNARGAVKES